MLLDIHGHPPLDHDRFPAFLAALERSDTRLLISDLGSHAGAWKYVPEVTHWQQGNALCADLVRAHPERLLGYCYVNPEHGREALAEMEWRLLGQPEVFGGLKLWVAMRCNDARLDPLMEFCAAYGVPVLQHTWMKLGPTGPGSGNLPGESTPGDLLALARRHPQVRFFGGHTGGDWEWGVSALRQVDNVWLDIAGGDATGGYMEIALAAVGAGRIVYGTDVTGRSVPSQLAKVLALDLPDADLERILWRNAAEVLGARLPARWRSHFEGQNGASAGASAGATATPTATDRPLVVTWESARRPQVPAPPPEGLVDANSFVGEWPSRRLNGSPPAAPAAVLAARRQLMDGLGIRRAAVSLLDAVWLKDSGVANAELHGLVGDDPQRFFPVYTLNPTFPTWRVHLDRCVEVYGLAAGRGAVRFAPNHHGYRLDDAATDPCLDRLEALGLPLVLTWQLEDARMQAPGMSVPDLDAESVAGLAARRPGLRLLVTGAVQSQIMATLSRLPASARVWFDTSRIQGPIDGIPMLCRATATIDADGGAPAAGAEDDAARLAKGARRLVFGTNLPLHVAQSPVMELADAMLAGLSTAGAAAIGHGNAWAALGLDLQTG